MNSTRPAAASPQETESTFLALPLAAFAYVGSAEVNVYCLERDQSTVRLFRPHDRPFTATELGELKRTGTQTLLVKYSDYSQVTSLLYANLEDLAKDARITPSERMVLAQAAIHDVLEISWGMLRPDRFVDLSRRFAGIVSGLVHAADANLATMFPVLQHGGSYAVHATNVAYYAAVLARVLGESSVDRLREFALGAMLHDLGLRPKRQLPSHAAPSRGTNWRNEDGEESCSWHPQLAFEELSARPDVTETQRLMAYQHHENVDGTGYPVGLVGDEIHPWSRLLSVVDCFDTLTCGLPGQNRLSAPSALVVLEAHLGQSLDAEYTECWIKAFHRK
jgi:HD-GYP domain-containing protein (c-di-GMP phosphodiesterase class II)